MTGHDPIPADKETPGTVPPGTESPAPEPPGPDRARPGLEPHPPRIPSLAFGLAFVAAGVAGLVAGTEQDEVALWLFPVILVAAGLAGLVAALGRTR